MRIVLVVLMWVILVGGLAFYMHERVEVQTAPEMNERTASGTYTLEVTTTFPLEPDPFALRTESSEDAPALVVRIDGREVLRRTDKVEPGAPIRVGPITGLKAGDNELYVEANPPLDSADKSQAVRIRLFQGPHVIADRSLWSEQGNRIAAVFSVHIEQQDTKGRDPHGH